MIQNSWMPTYSAAIVILQRKNSIFLRIVSNTIFEVIIMAKQGMKRPGRTHTKSRNDTAPVPELQGKAKRGKEKANPMIAGTQKVYHTAPRAISSAYSVFDGDLANDNLKNDLAAADLQDL